VSAASLTVLKAVTNQSGSVSSSTSPYSTYAATTGAVAVWHFDESTGTILGDSTIHQHTAFMRCGTPACVSTATFTAAPDGLGAAIRFPGQQDSFVSVTTSTLFDSPGSAFGLTLEAWVNLGSLFQGDKASIVVKGRSTEIG